MNKNSKKIPYKFIILSTVTLLFICTLHTYLFSQTARIQRVVQRTIPSLVSLERKNIQPLDDRYAHITVSSKDAEQLNHFIHTSPDTCILSVPCFMRSSDQIYSDISYSDGKKMVNIPIVECAGGGHNRNGYHESFGICRTKQPGEFIVNQSIFHDGIEGGESKWHIPGFGI